MIRVHPKSISVAGAALVALSMSMLGCKSTSSGVGNPFLAPDRVPPPSTHALLPGQAQPYYQGDPLPSASQSPAKPSASAVAANTNQTTLSPNGRTLAWNMPGAAAAASPPGPVPPATAAIAPPPGQPIVAVNEGPVAVPAD